MSGINKITKKTNCLIIYPWPGALKCSNGAALRLSLLIKFLKSYFDKITVLYPGDISVQINNVYYKNFRQTKINLFISRIIRKILKLYYNISKKDRHVIVHIWLCFRYLLDKTVKNLFKNEIERADVIILKYFYYFPLVQKYAKKFNKKLIVANYDVTAEQVYGKKLRNAIFRREVKALKEADIPIVLAEHDRQVFERGGVGRIQLIKNGIDCDKTLSLRCTRVFLLRILNDCYNIKLNNDEKICLFVGSKMLPNNIAAKHIENFSKNFLDKYAEEKVRFIIVGTCYPICKEKNLLGLGFVESILLHFLYQLADIVLVPLDTGTGSSLKTVEAFTYGKLIIGTDVAFRGIDVSNGINCIIENDFTKYPSIIRENLETSFLKENIKKNALLLGRTQDYRLFNKDYLELLKKLDIPLKKGTDITVPQMTDYNELNDYSEINTDLINIYFPDSKNFFKKISC